MVQNIDYVLASRELNVQCHWIYTSEFHRQLLLFTWSWILRLYSENIHWLSLAVGFYISGSLNQGLIHTSRFFSWKPVSCHYFSIYIQTPFYSTSTILLLLWLSILKRWTDYCTITCIYLPEDLMSILSFQGFKRWTHYCFRFSFLKTIIIMNLLGGKHCHCCQILLSFFHLSSPNYLIMTLLPDPTNSFKNWLILSLGVEVTFLFVFLRQPLGFRFKVSVLIYYLIASTVVR